MQATQQSVNPRCLGMGCSMQSSRRGTQARKVGRYFSSGGPQPALDSTRLDLQSNLGT